MLLGKTLSEARGESTGELALRGREKEKRHDAFITLLFVVIMKTHNPSGNSLKQQTLPVAWAFAVASLSVLTHSPPPTHQVSQSSKSIALTVYPQIFILFCLKFHFYSSLLAPAFLSILTHLLFQQVFT